MDIWLAGVLLYVCLCGFPPFSDELGPPNMRDQIIQGKYAFYSPFWDDISDSALDLISNLLVVDPSERFDIVQTCNHFWFQETDESISMEISQEKTQHPVREPVRNNTQPLTLREKYASELNFVERSSAL